MLSSSKSSGLSAIIKNIPLIPNAATPTDMRVVDIIVIVFAVSIIIVPITVDIIDMMSDMIEAMFLTTFQGESIC